MKAMYMTNFTSIISVLSYQKNENSLIKIKKEYPYQRNYFLWETIKIHRLNVQGFLPVHHELQGQGRIVKKIVTTE